MGINQMASVRKRTWVTADGEQHEAWVVAYRDKDKRQRIETFAKKGEALDKRREVEGALKVGVHVPASSKTTLADAARAWIERGEAEGLERSTILQRQQHVDLHISPLLGAETRVAKLTRPMIESFRDQLLKTRSPALARKVLTSLKSCLKDATSRGMIGQNVARDVEIKANGGRHRKRLEIGRDIPDQREVQALLSAATGMMRPLLAVLVFCGLRMSEVRALRWQDVDLEARQLHVRQRADKWATVGALKTETSYRSVPLAPMVVNSVKEWKLACPRRGVTKDQDGKVIDPGELVLVFPNGAGNVESLPNIWNRHLAPLQVAAGIADPVLRGGKPVLVDGKPKMRARYGAHSFRHFFASWLIEQKFNVKRVSVLMGHSSPVVTLTIYSHLLPADDDHAAFAAGELALVGS
jgi:integrase